MSTASGAIQKINWAIKILGKDEFTLDELKAKLKERYRVWTPSNYALKRYLSWPQINATEHNGKYKKINR